jgi:hypothetical protein
MSIIEYCISIQKDIIKSLEQIIELREIELYQKIHNIRKKVKYDPYFVNTVSSYNCIDMNNRCKVHKRIKYDPLFISQLTNNCS